MNILIVN